jgi:hypothetical protein
VATVAMMIFAKRIIAFAYADIDLDGDGQAPSTVPAAPTFRIERKARYAPPRRSMGIRFMAARQSWDRDADAPQAGDQGLR